MFTEILSVVVLLAFPTVVIVTVGPAYCCYCSSPRTVVSVPLRHPAPRATLPQLLLRSGDSVKNGTQLSVSWEKIKKIGQKGTRQARTSDSAQNLDCFDHYTKIEEAFRDSKRIS